jgi:hypothetical protein
MTFEATIKFLAFINVLFRCLFLILLPIIYHLKFHIIGIVLYFSVDLTIDSSL